MNTAQIIFPLDQGESTATLIYRPWGIRTLKIQVTVSEEKAGDFPALRLRPRRMADTAATGMACGYADAGDAFLVSWGGGHEPGPCIKASDDGHVEGCVPLAADDTSNIFLNLKHQGPATPETAVLTLEAYDPETDDVKASLAVTLQKPAAYPEDQMRLERREGGGWEMGNGRLLPAYDPRWQPHQEVTYRQVEPLPLAIRRDGRTLRVFWDGDKEIITIHDRTRPSMLDDDLPPEQYAPGGVDVELFDWDEEYVVLRVWFAWLNVNIPFHVARLESTQHEVPDAERFDFLIRKKNGKIALACTDLHWREMWGVMDDMPVTASVGLTAGTLLKLAFDKVVMDKLVKGQKLPYDMLLGFVQRQAEDFARLDDASEEKTVLAPGLQAHVPTLDNVTQSPNLTSRDVRYE
jgi:hypothetical protein